MAESLEHIYKGVRYTCVGNGLLKDGHLYEAHLEKFLPSRNGTSQSIEKKLVSWWKAQCAFRGLNQTGAMNDLQLRLREAKANMLPQLKTAQTELNREYKKSNKIKETWTTLKTVEQKAKADPERFLNEAFPRGATGRPANLDFVVVKLQDHPALADAADQLGLERVSVDAPWNSGKKPSPDRWLIIGRSRDAVWNKMQEIQRETIRSKQANPKPVAEAQKSSPAPRKKQTVEKSDAGVRLGRESRPYSHVPGGPSRLQAVPPTEPTPKPRTKQTAIRLAPFPTSGASFTNQAEVAKGAWEFEGLYKISCPALEAEWPQKVELSLNVILMEMDGKRQMYAEFDFGIVKGLMRFEKPTPAPKTEPVSSKRKREKDLDDEGDMYRYPLYDGADDSVYKETVFNLASKDIPTVRRPIWRYRWRGRDTSEGQIQLGSDKVVDTITFEKGGKLSGMFTCQMAQRCAFTGIILKTSKPVDEGGPGYIDQSWQDLGADTYSYEERSRWGGSGGYRGWR